MNIFLASAFQCCIFVTFLSSTVCVASSDDMKNIIRKMDGAELNGKRIKIIDVSRPLF